MSFIIYILILFLISCFSLYWAAFMLKRLDNVQLFRVTYSNHTFNSMWFYFWIPLEPRYWNNFQYPELDDDKTYHLFYGLYLYIKYKILS